MKVVIPKECRPDERRVAATPDTVKAMTGMGLEVTVEQGAGNGAFFTDEDFRAAGATIATDAVAALAEADIVLKVRRPLLAGDIRDELGPLRSGTVLIGILQPHEHADAVDAYAAAGVNAFALELVPRIARAQSMDVLSSQASLSGYRAVIDAAAEFGRAFPMMMTAAGTIAPARVFVLGAGVAGLQAIATARRLGAVVFATDVRAAAKEQVESLGASFVMVDQAAMLQASETVGGYAKEMAEDFKRRQHEKVFETMKRTDIAISTALIPGRKAPVLITAEMVAAMRPGSIVVDLAVEHGGNCEGSREGETVLTENGVRILGYANMPSRVPVDASRLYAKNVINFLSHILGQRAEAGFSTEDEIVRATLLTQGGAVIHPLLAKPVAEPVPVASTGGG